MNRRFRAGQSFRKGPFVYRIVTGRKAANDLVIEQYVDKRWHPIPFHIGALLADFWYENEDVLYPPSDGFLGGKKLLRFLNDSVHHGFRHTCHHLDTEKQLKHRRPS